MGLNLSKHSRLAMAILSCLVTVGTPASSIALASAAVTAPTIDYHLTDVDSHFFEQRLRRVTDIKVDEETQAVFRTKTIQSTDGSVVLQ